MTTPKVETTWVQGDRWYVTGDKRAPGVSGIIGMLPKGALMHWYGKMAAEFAVDNLDIVEALAATDRAAAIELVKGAAKRSASKSADVGTLVHAYTEQLARDMLNGKKSSFRVGPDVMPYLRNYARFVREFNVRPVLVENTVWSEAHRYAGTFDLLSWLDVPEREDLQARGIEPGEQLAIVDTKTGASGVWAEAALQQTAYKRAEYYIDPVSGAFLPMPAVTHTYGLWLRPNGWALIPLESGDASWEQFLRLRGSYEWKTTEEKRAVGKALNAQPLTRQWRG